MEKNLSGIQPSVLSNRELAHYIWLHGVGAVPAAYLEELLKRFNELIDDGK